MGDDPSILDEETNRDIQKMRSVYHEALLSCSAAVVYCMLMLMSLLLLLLPLICRNEFVTNKGQVLQMMAEHTLRVQLRVPEARKL